MEWLSVEEKKPENLSMAWVKCSKGWMGGVRAFYHSSEDAWILFDPSYREKIVLDVTHWWPLPQD